MNGRGPVRVARLLGAAESGGPGIEPRSAVLETTVVAIRPVPQVRAADGTAIPRGPAVPSDLVRTYVRDMDDRPTTGRTATCSACTSATARRRGPAQLVIACDAVSRLIEDAGAILARLSSGCHRTCRMHPRHGRAAGPSVPQHGPGRKHERPIVLEAWQREIVDAFPVAIPSRAAALGRVPDGQPVQDQAAERACRVRVSALVLLELSATSAGCSARLRALDPLDAVQPPQHLGLPPPQRRAAGRVMSSAAASKAVGRVAEQPEARLSTSGLPLASRSRRCDLGVERGRRCRWRSPGRRAGAVLGGQLDRAAVAGGQQLALALPPPRPGRRRG